MKRRAPPLILGTALQAAVMGAAWAAPETVNAPPASEPSGNTRSADGTEAGRVLWLMPQLDSAPSSASAGQPAPRRPLAQVMADYLISHWGDKTRHEVVIVNIKRGMRELQSSETACMLAVLHTRERDAQVWFADTHLVPPHQFVVRASALSKVPRTASGEVDLARVWSERRLRGAVVQGRSYGAELDALLKRQPGDLMSSYVTPDFGSNLLAMLSIGRADYTIEYDFILADHLASRPGPPDLVAIPIQGYSEPVLSGVACPRNDWGRRAVDRINQILGTPQARQLLKDEFLSHLSPEARARYGARIEAFYARPVPPPLPSSRATSITR